MQKQDNNNDIEYKALINKVGENLLLARLRANLKQTDVETRTGIPQATLSRYERGAGSPSIKTLFTLSRCYKISVSELFL